MGKTSGDDRSSGKRRLHGYRYALQHIDGADD
jgi:hypothetical protein